MLKVDMRKFVALGLVVGLSVVFSLFLTFLEDDVGRRQEKHSSGGATRKNVLMIIADDLRPQLGVYHNGGLSDLIFPGMKTTHLDELAAKSLLVQNAFVQYAVCGPSRSSTLTSRRPQTTQVYDLHAYWRKVGGDYTTLPQYFKEQGYLTQGLGKIFHHGRSSGGDNDAVSWTHPFVQLEAMFWKGKFRSWNAVSEEQRRVHPLMDDKVLQKSIEALVGLSEEAKEKQTNFFLAVGFYKPHLPWICPSEYFSEYPLSEMDVALNKYAPQNVPPIAGSHAHELLKYADIQREGISGLYNDTFPDTLSKELRRAYYACVSYIDHQIGQLLGTLGALGLEKDTIVAFWGDHGFLLGEQGSWCKHSMFELAARVPLMLRVPGSTDRGITTNHLVELVDLFPTLVEVAGLPAILQCPKYSRNVTLCTEGNSFASLIREPSISTWKTRVFTEQMRELSDEKIMGRSVRTKDFRYTEWTEEINGSNDQRILHGRELYNLKEDTMQKTNVVEKKEYENVVNMLVRDLKGGWSDAKT